MSSALGWSTGVLSTWHVLPEFVIFFSIALFLIAINFNNFFIDNIIASVTNYINILQLLTITIN